MLSRPYNFAGLRKVIDKSSRSGGGRVPLTLTRLGDSYQPGRFPPRAEQWCQVLLLVVTWGGMLPARIHPHYKNLFLASLFIKWLSRSFPSPGIISTFSGPMLLSALLQSCHIRSAGLRGRFPLPDPRHTAFSVRKCLTWMSPDWVRWLDVSGKCLKALDRVRVVGKEETRICAQCDFRR